MECPYCHNKMELGIIHGDRYALKWIPKEKDKGIFLHPFVKGIKLDNTNFGNSIECYYCKDCKKIIMDVPGIDY